jgi:hypothetical protein
LPRRIGRTPRHRAPLRSFLIVPTCACTAGRLERLLPWRLNFSSARTYFPVPSRSQTSGRNAWNPTGGGCRAGSPGYWGQPPGWRWLGAASPSPRLTLVTARQAIRRGPPTRCQMPAHLCRSPARRVPSRRPLSPARRASAPRSRSPARPARARPCQPRSRQPQTPPRLSLRLAHPPSAEADGDPVHSDCKDAVRQAGLLLKTLGHRVDVRLARLDSEATIAEARGHRRETMVPPPPTA